MSRALRREGLRTYRSDIRVNVGCTLAVAAQLEERLEEIAQRRGSRVQIVGHSLGGMLARGVAARRPDLVSGIVTMGSPMLAPGAHHVSLARSVDLLVRLHRAGMRGLMAEDCVAGNCARESFDQARAELPADVAFTAIYSRRDGIVDWRACIDPVAVPVEVRVVTRRHGPRPAGHRRRRASVTPAGRGDQLSKSIGERSRSFESRCSAVIERTVPLRERITSECVVTPSPR